MLPSSSPFPQVVIFQTPSLLGKDEESQCSLLMTWDVATASWSMNCSPFLTNLTSAASNRQGAYALLFELCEHLASYFFSREASEHIDEEEKQKWTDQIAGIRQTIAGSLFDEDIDPKVECIFFCFMLLHDLCLWSDL